MVTRGKALSQGSRGCHKRGKGLSQGAREERNMYLLEKILDLVMSRGGGMAMGEGWGKWVEEGMERKIARQATAVLTFFNMTLSSNLDHYFAVQRHFSK